MLTIAALTSAGLRHGLQVKPFEGGVLLSDGRQSVAMDDVRTVLLSAEGEFSLIEREDAVRLFGLFGHEGVGDRDIETGVVEVSCLYCDGAVTDQTCEALLLQEQQS